MGPTGHLVTIKRSGLDGPHFPLSLSTCLFGRSTECDIRIQLPIVSKQHCKIEIKEQKAILFNFSSTYPTQLNGSAIDEPVQLKHGDVITIFDRSFRYEEENHQDGSKSTEFPGQRNEQASLRRVSRSGFYSDPDGKVQDPKTCSKRSKLTEESVSGRPLVHVGEVRAAPTASPVSEEPVARETPPVHLSHVPGDEGREAAGPTAGDAKDVSSVRERSGDGQLPSCPPIQCPEKSEDNESPFRELYESMKEKLDRSGKEKVLRSRRKSGPQSHCVAENESAGGSQGETPRPVSPKSRRTSGRSTQSKADPASGAQPGGQTEEEGTHAGPGQTPKVTVSPSAPRTEATEARTPGPCSHPSFTPTRRSGGRSVVSGDGPVNLNKSRESSRAHHGTLLPRKSLTRNQTPTAPEDADDVGNTPGKVSSRKRRRSSSVPTNPDLLIIETETHKQTALAPRLIQVQRKMPDGALGTSEPLGTPGGQRCPGSPGLHSVDVSNLGDSTNMMEGMPLKRRRVSFGGRLRPELFDENLPPNTPLKRGETPMKRRSLVTHTATTALKKIIKEQSQPSGKEDSSSETHLGVTAQNVLRSSPARNPVKTPAANDKRQRSSEPSSASSEGASPQPTETPKRGGRRSSSGPSRRTSVDRSQQEILQLIHSKRRSGASEANLIVAKSWADVVKLSAKQTQTKVVKHGPRRQLNKRQRRINTPKKPTSSIHNQFSTGHANSPCTIVVGKAHLEKVNVPARPYRMLNNFVFNKKIDFNEDLSGLTEMFKTPAKEKPQVRSLCPITFSNSEDLPRVPKPEEKPLLYTPENYGDNVFPSTQNVPGQMPDKRSASLALKRHCFAVNENMKTLLSEAEPPKVESSTNKFRKSMELRNTQVPGAECENKNEETNAAENILGRHLRKTREEELEEEMKESERTFETCEKNIESKENSEKMIGVKRSRRSSEMKYAQRADLITPKKLQEIEPKKELVDIHSLGTPGHTKENQTAVMNYKSPGPDSVSTPVKMNVRIKLSSQKVNVGQLSALGRSTQTPGETTHSYREQVCDDKIIELFKETPKQKSDPTENVTGSRRRSRTPKKTIQPLEDLAGFRELFQTPKRTVEPGTDDRTTKIPHKSPKPESVITPGDDRTTKIPHTSPKPESVITPGDDKDIRAFKETPEQKLDHIENVTGSRRRSRTPQRKVPPLEDMAGLKELFQTPKRTVEPVTDDRTTKKPHKSPKSERVSMPGDDKDIREFNETPKQKLDSAENVTGNRKRPKTPKRKVQPLEDMAGLKELFQTPKPTVEPGTDDRTIKIPHKSPKLESVITPGDDKDIIRAFKETPEQKLDHMENVTGSRRRLRTPQRKIPPLEGMAGLKELFQTPKRTVEPVTDDRTTKTPHKSPKSERVSMPGGDKDIREFSETPEQKLDSAENVTGNRKRPRSPKRKVQPLEDMAGFKELFQTPKRTVEPGTDDRTIKIPHKSPKLESVITPGDDKDIRAFKETPEQKLDHTENVTGSRRRLRTPQRKIPPLEDMAGLKELFQTPKRTVESVTDDRTTKTPHKSPKSERVSMPGGDKDIGEFNETPEQKLDHIENVTGSRRRLRTPQRKIPPLEDMVGLKELFQTPKRTVETVTDDRTTKTPHKSPKSERVSMPGGDKDIREFSEIPEQKLDSAENVTGNRKRPRSPKRKVQPLEDMAGFKELFQTPKCTVEPVIDDKTTKIPHKSPKPERVSMPGDKDIREFNETLEQKLDSAENVTGSRKRPRTPRRKVQPLEDMAGFKELFQTPNHSMEPEVDDKTKLVCQSTQSEPVVISTSMPRHLRTPTQKVSGEEDVSALRKSTQTPGGTMGSPRDPVGDGKVIKFFKKTPEQKLDTAENITGSRKKPRTPKRKVQPLEDMAGFRELFQTPNRTVEPVVDDKTTKIPHKSPKPEPVSTPGDDKDIKAFKDTPERKLGSAENVTGSRKRARSPKRKVQPLEDMSGFKELFQNPKCTVKPVTDDETKIPCKSPQAEVVMPIGRKSCLKAPPTKADVEVEPLSLRKATRTSWETTRSHREPESDKKDVTVFKESAVQKLDPAKYVTRSKRKPRTPEEKAQPLEDLAGLEEPFQTSDHTDEPVTVVKTSRMHGQSSQPGLGILPASKKRQLKAAPGTADREEEPTVLRKPTGASRKTMRSHREPDDDKDVTVFKESAVQKPDPAKNVTRSKRKPRTPEEKAQPLEDLAGLEEPFQTDHTDEPVTVVKTTRMHGQSSQPGPGILPASKKRQLKAAPGRADKEEELTALRKPTRTGRSTRAHRESVDGHQDIIVCEGTAKPKRGPAENATGSKRLLRTRKEKAPPLEVPAGCPELLQTADPDKEHGDNAENVKMTPTQTPDRREPVKTSRRVLRAPPVKPMDDLGGSRDPVKSQSESSVSQYPKRKRRKEGTVTGRERLGSMTCPQDTAPETSLQKRQRTAPRERCEPPAPLITRKKSQRVLAGRTEPVEGLSSNSMRTKAQERKAEAVASPAKGISLRSRPPNKTSGAKQRRSEFLESAEKTNTKRKEKKAPNTSQEVTLQHPEDGAKNCTSGGQVRERRMCLRSGRQSTKHLSDVTEEKPWEKSVEMHVMKKTQEKKEGSKPSGSVGLRPKKMTVCPTGDTLEKESKQRVTRSVKRSTENINKEDDNGCIKKLRTRRQRGSEDI